MNKLENTLTSHTEVRPGNPNLIESSEKNIRIHYNLNNTALQSKTASFSETRVTPILNDPSQYEVCVEYCKLVSSVVISTQQRLVFVTDAPVLSELEFGQKNITQKIVGYCFFQQADPADNLLYDPTQYRWFDMISSHPMKEFSVYVGLQNADGTISPISLASSESISFNVYFRKKIQNFF
jgi:hypothetical protein